MLMLMSLLVSMSLLVFDINVGANGVVDTKVNVDVMAMLIWQWHC